MGNNFLHTSSNNKLENKEPLPDRRQDIMVSRVRIGHTHLTHKYLLKIETAKNKQKKAQYILLSVNNISKKKTYFEPESIKLCTSVVEAIKSRTKYLDFDIE